MDTAYLINHPFPSNSPETIPATCFPDPDHPSTKPRPRTPHPFPLPVPNPEAAPSPKLRSFAQRLTPSIHPDATRYVRTERLPTRAELRRTKSVLDTPVAYAAVGREIPGRDAAYENMMMPLTASIFAQTYRYGSGLIPSANPGRTVTPLATPKQSYAERPWGVDNDFAKVELEVSEEGLPAVDFLCRRQVERSTSGKRGEPVSKICVRADGGRFIKSASSDYIPAHALVPVIPVDHGEWGRDRSEACWLGNGGANAGFPRAFSWRRMSFGSRGSDGGRRSGGIGREEREVERRASNVGHGGRYSSERGMENGAGRMSKRFSRMKESTRGGEKRGMGRFGIRRSETRVDMLMDVGKFDGMHQEPGPPRPRNVREYGTYSGQSTQKDGGKECYGVQQKEPGRKRRGSITNGRRGAERGSMDGLEKKLKRPEKTSFFSFLWGRRGNGGGNDNGAVPGVASSKRSTSIEQGSTSTNTHTRTYPYYSAYGLPSFSY